MNGPGPGCLAVHSGTAIAVVTPRDPTDPVIVCRGVVRADCPHGPRPLDATGYLVAPGLVDIHLHGALGHDLSDPAPAAWRTVLDAHLRAGTTTALATVATCPPAATSSALATAAALMSGGTAPTLAGVHLEGPCVAPGQRGAQDAAHLRDPHALHGELTPLPSALRMVTLAPELPGADDLIAYLHERQVLVSAGHSQAGTEDLRHAQALGLTHLAHLWSGQSALTRPGLHRVAGLVEASLASDSVTAEIIADGHHLPPELLRIALRCLGPDRLCLISDASAGTWLPPGATFLTGTTRGRVLDDHAATVDGASLCGSIAPLGVMLTRMRHLSGADVRDVITMATATPARVIGRYPAKGSLAFGADGDLVLLDPGLTVRRVVLAGRPLPAGAR